jgi:hypothetical protein
MSITSTKIGVSINKEYLESLNPCKNRFDHYLIHYSNWQGSLEEFLDLSELTHEDKKWVFIRSIPREKLKLLAADFAERVLHIYESKHLNDDRPRKAIEAARSGNRYASAYAEAAYAAAYAADAAYAAAYAADAAEAYADAIYAAYAGRKDEEHTQIEIMKRYARGEK